MITPELIQRINELAKKKKANTITEEELVEQTKLRRIYIDYFKMHVKHHLDNIEFVDTPPRKLH